jgi:uncharacterized protein YyaL (SSP411 family)
VLSAREARIRPARDEKVLTAWNGLMIGALAKGYAVTGDERFLDGGVAAARFILESLQTPDGRLLRSSHRGVGRVPAFLEDYAFFVQGLLALYQVTLQGPWLEEALRLTGDMLRLFDDHGGGGLFDSGNDAEKLLVRKKGAADGVIPSGNSVAALNLLQLGRITGDDRFSSAAEKLLMAFSGDMAREPAGYLSLLMAFDLLRNPPLETTLLGDPDAPEAVAMRRELGRRFLPGLVIRVEEGKGGGMPVAVNRPAVSLCAGGACRPPVYAAEELARLLDEVA